MEDVVVAGTPADTERRHDHRRASRAWIVRRRGDHDTALERRAEREPRGVVESEVADSGTHHLDEAGLHHADDAEVGHAVELRRRRERGVLHAEQLVPARMSPRRVGERVERRVEADIPHGVHGDGEAPRHGSLHSVVEIGERDAGANGMTVDVGVDARSGAAVSKELERTHAEPFVALAGGWPVQPIRVHT
jgi:hypothetical protein